MDQLKKGGNHNLANKISKLVCFLLIIIFTILIVSSLISSQNAISTATFNSLSESSKANGCQIQEFMNISKSAASSLVSYINESFEKEKNQPANNLLNEAEQSVVYDTLKLNRVKKDLEAYMIATAKNVVKSNDSVIGIGIMFEPYKYTKDRESYALYFTSNGSEIEVSDVGDYNDFSKEDYYQIAVGKTETVFTEPYIYRDMWMISGATPIIVNGEMVGIINVDISMSEFNKLNLTNEIYPSLNTKVITNEGILVFDSENEDNISKNMTETMFLNNDVANKALSQIPSNSTEHFKIKYRNSNGQSVYSFFYPLIAGNQIWHTVSTVSNYDIQKSTIRTIFISIVVSVISLILIIFIIIRILKSSINPINEVVLAANDIANGNLDINLQVKSNDEIGILSSTFISTCNSLKDIINDISDILDKMSNNNLDVDINADYKGNFSKIKVSILNIVNNLNYTVKNISQSSEQVLHSSEQLSVTSQLLASGSTEGANSLDMLSEIIRDVSEQVNKNANQAAKTSELVKDVGKEAINNNNQMENMIKAMDDITDSSNQIKLIIQSIEDIASQTNLLSLNASIEAARAGEAGKGFAVVANQIGELANQSSEAAKNTRALIENSINSIESGKQTADLMGNSTKVLLNEIEDVITQIEEMTSNSTAQKESILYIEQNVTKISDVVQSNSSAAEECATTSEELASQSQTLKSLVEKFNLKP